MEDSIMFYSKFFNQDYRMKVVRSFSLLLLVILICISNFQCTRLEDSNESLLKKVGVSRGICIILGDREGELSIPLRNLGEQHPYAHCTIDSSH